MCQFHSKIFIVSAARPPLVTDNWGVELAHHLPYISSWIEIDDGDGWKIAVKALRGYMLGNV